MVKRTTKTETLYYHFFVNERAREKIPQIFLAQEVDPFFDKDNQCSPNMTSADVSVHLNCKET